MIELFKKEKRARDLKMNMNSKMIAQKIGDKKDDSCCTLFWQVIKVSRIYTELI